MTHSSIYYFKLTVADAENLARFYSLVFGMTEVRRIDALHYSEPHLEIFLSTGSEKSGNQIALLHWVDKPAPVPGEAAIAFMVDDVDAVVAAALAAGGTSTMAAETLEEHKFRYAIIADPEGHAVEVMQTLA